MFNAIQRVKYYALCYTWGEVLWSFLYMERSFALILIHEVKLYAHCYTWSEAVCSMLHKE